MQIAYTCRWVVGACPSTPAPRRSSSTVLRPASFTFGSLVRVSESRHLVVLGTIGECAEKLFTCDTLSSDVRSEVSRMACLIRVLETSL